MMKKNRSFSKNLIFSTLVIIFLNLTLCASLFAQQLVDRNLVDDHRDLVKEFIDGNKKELKIGFREQSYPISYLNPNSGNDSNLKEYQGFCNIFADELFERLKNHIERELHLNKKLSTLQINKKIESLKLVKSDVINFTQGGFIKRYDGVIKGIIDVECGTNSIRHDVQEPIEFSKAFLQNGISLLATKENLEKVKANEKQLGNLRVGVISETTTYQWLVEEKGFLPISYSSRSEAIRDLKKGVIDAYVTDYVILKGISETNKDLKNNEYDLYPKYLKEQEYGLVIKKGQSKFKEIINETIDSDKLSSEIAWLKNNYSLERKPDNWILKILTNIDFIHYILLISLIPFLLGILISAFLPRNTVSSLRQKISEVFLGFWELIRSDLVGCLYSLWKLLLKLLFRK
jgi:ABC-type amino acid transport substrate-binding protein